MAGKEKGAGGRGRLGRLKRVLTPWLFLAPSLGGVTVFTAVPFLDVVRRSFQDAMGRRFVGLDNYRAVADNSAFRLAAGNTARFLLICIPLLMVLSFGAALLLAGGADSSRESGVLEDISGEGDRDGRNRRQRGKRYGIFRTTLVLPMTIPAAGMVLVWKIFLCPDGVLNQFLTGVTGQVWEVDWAFSRWAFSVLIATYLWKNIGYDMILWLAGLGGISGELYEAAQMDGAGLWARLRYVTIPSLRGTCGLVGILSVVNSFRVYREAYLLAGSYPDSSIYLLPHLFAHWFLKLDVQKMTAAAVMLTAAAVIPAAGIWISKRGRKE